MVRERRAGNAVRIKSTARISKRPSRIMETLNTMCHGEQSVMAGQRARPTEHATVHGPQVGDIVLRKAVRRPVSDLGHRHPDNELDRAD